MPHYNANTIHKELIAGRIGYNIELAEMVYGPNRLLSLRSHVTNASWNLALMPKLTEHIIIILLPKFERKRI